MKKLFYLVIAILLIANVSFANDNLPETAPESYLKDAILQTIQNQEKVTIDLYVMSQCPYGVKAEKALVPIINELGGQVKFNLFFIANAIEVKSTTGLTVQAFPNPTSGVSTLYIPSNIQGEIIVYVINTEGKPVKILHYNIQEGENLFFMDLNELTTGFYHIAVEHDGQLKVKSDVMVIK